MQKTLAIKIGIIALLCGIFTIGLAMFSSVITERQHYANNVIIEIANQHVRPQNIVTPFLITRQSVINNCDAKNDTSNANTVIKNSETCEKTSIVNIPTFASQTNSKQTLTVSDDTYKRSIYAATSYQGNINFEQTYDLQQKNLSTNTSAIVANKSPKQLDTRLLIPVSDLRGVNKMPEVTINGQQLKAAYPKTKILEGLSYLEVVLPKTLHNTKELSIEVDLFLSGLEQLKTTPLGEQFKLTTAANWHSPNFIGNALPNQKTISENRFDATWQNQHIAIGNNQKVTQCLEKAQKNCAINQKVYTDNYAYTETYATREAIDATNTPYTSVSLNSFGVDFAEPNNVYLQTDRTLKYALLIIAVSFGSFFLFEVIKSLRIHPIQYLLVGMALLVFYALLLSLAEQITFWQAYFIAAAACAGLIGWYAFHVLHSGKRALLFTLILAAQYAGFYTILTMEELNLLVGAVFCFIVIASVMFLTRKIDWYKIA